jgi:uncharacterized DUF497 family protein
VSFEWDPRKASSNLRKHGVRFAEATGALHDELAITIRDRESDPSEERFVTLGMGMKGRVLIVVYCFRGGNIRIISARKAEPSECEQYEAQR